MLNAIARGSKKWVSSLWIKLTFCVVLIWIADVHNWALITAWYTWSTLTAEVIVQFAIWEFARKVACVVSYKVFIWHCMLESLHTIFHLRYDLP